jgi:hypothetical protein
LQELIAGLSVGQQFDCILQVLSVPRESRYASSIMVHTGFFRFANDCH